MDYGSFPDDILKPLEARVPDFDPGRVWTAYTDATNMADVIARLERDIGGRDAVQLNAAGTDAAAKEATEVFFLDNYIGTLHKALIEFANIFMVVLLHELQGRPKREPTVLTLAESPLALRIDRYTLHRAYCLYVYRNKVIVHHDVPRSFMTVQNRIDGRRWLNPIPHRIDEGKDIDPGLLRALYTLKHWFSSNPAVAAETVPMEIASPLFYAIAGPYAEKVSRKRDLINKIVEHIGCRSMTVEEIVETIDSFTLELTRIAPLSTQPATGTA